jgi:hypothetical protein
MFGTVFPSQHSTQYVRHIVTDVKCAEIQTSIHSYSGVARQGISHYQNSPWHVHLLHLFIKMTDIIIFSESLLSRLQELFSFIYHSISNSEHPMSNTDVRNDRGETPGGPFVFYRHTYVCINLKHIQPYTCKHDHILIEYRIQIIYIYLFLKSNKKIQVQFNSIIK